MNEVDLERNVVASKYRAVHESFCEFWSVQPLEKVHKRFTACQNFPHNFERFDEVIEHLPVRTWRVVFGVCTLTKTVRLTFTEIFSKMKLIAAVLSILSVASFTDAGECESMMEMEIGDLTKLSFSGFDPTVKR